MTPAERAQRYRARRRQAGTTEPMGEVERQARRAITRIVERYVYRVKDAAGQEGSPHHLGPQGQQRLARLLDDVADAMLGRTPEITAQTARLRQEAMDRFCPVDRGVRTITLDDTEAMARWIEDRLPRRPLG